MQSKRKTQPEFATIARGDIETVKRAIAAKYGFPVTDEYARDLIAFVEQVTKGTQDD